MTERTDYAQLFRAHLHRALRYGGAQLEAAGNGAATTAVVQTLLHTVEFALEAEALWAETGPLLLRMTPALEHLGWYAEWIPYLTRAIALSQRVGDDEAGAELRYHLGMFHLTQGETDAAAAALQESYEYFSKRDGAERRARGLNGLARVSQATGQLGEAVALALRALAAAGKNSDEEQGMSYRILGTIASNRREWARALEYFEKDLAIWRARKVPRRVAQALLNEGTALRALQRSAEAIEVYQEAITLFEREDDPVHLAAAQMNLGNVYLGLKAYPEALEAYVAAEWTLREVNDATRLAMLYNNLGMAYGGMGAREQAEQYYWESVARWKALKNERARLNVMDNLGELYLNWGRKKEACTVLSEARALAAVVGDPYLSGVVEAHWLSAQAL